MTPQMKKIFLLAFVLPFLVKAQTTLPTFWNFSTPGIATPPTGWITGLGTNGNLTYSGTANSVGGDGIACRLDLTGEFLTIWFADKPGAVSYWMRGTGISPTPAFTGTFAVQESADGSTWADMRTFTTAAPIPGTMTRFVDNPNAASRYVRFFYAAKESGSNVSLDSVLIRAAPAAPTATINLKQGAKTVVNSTTYVVGKSASTLFTIENKGTVDALNISSINLTGADAADYTITGAPTSIAANSSATFTLTFAPANIGSSKATMTINSNDADKAAYAVDLYGIGGNFASEPTTQATNLAFSNLKAYTFNTSFTKPNPAAEYYIVLRKRGAAITESPADGQSYKKGDYIGGAQVAYIGADTFFKPTYIFANSQYNFAVFAANGPAGFENYLTTAPLKATATTPGGNPGTYYAGINSNASNFVTALGAKTNPHDTVFYSLYIATMINNFLTRDTTGGKKVVNCVYTSAPYMYDEPFLWWTGTNSASLTREHTLAQSWMPSNKGTGWPNDPVTGKELPEYNDLHHLFPADQLLGNAKRSNYPFGIVVNPTYTSPTGQGKLGTDANGKTVWEPRDEQKGDLARAIFYMTVTYNGINGNNWSLGSINSGNQNDSILKVWHFQDLPDAYEIARNEYIASVQRNRNPFIDSVNFACRINFNNLSWIANPTNCGAAAQPSLTITSPVGGEIWFLDMRNANAKVKWNHTLVDSVQIDLMIEDTLFKRLGKVAAANDSFVVNLTGLPVSDKAKIKLSATNPILTSISPNYFSLELMGGVNTLLQANSLSVYPNPSTGLVTVDLKDASLTSATLTITDLAGRVVLEQTMQSSTTIELAQQGIYFLKLQTEKGSVVKKLVIE
jgi:endonuclease I